jgi:hypothetical protein
MEITFCGILAGITQSVMSMMFLAMLLLVAGEVYVIAVAFGGAVRSVLSPVVERCRSFTMTGAAIAVFMAGSGCLWGLSDPMWNSATRLLMPPHMVILKYSERNR